MAERRTHEWSETSPLPTVTDEFSDTWRKIRGDNVRIVIVKVKNVGFGGLVTLIVNPEIDSLAPHFERGV